MLSEADRLDRSWRIKAGMSRLFLHSKKKKRAGNGRKSGNRSMEWMDFDDDYEDDDYEDDDYEDDDYEDDDYEDDDYEDDDYEDDDYEDDDYEDDDYEDDDYEDDDYEDDDYEDDDYEDDDYEDDDYEDDDRTYTFRRRRRDGLGRIIDFLEERTLTDYAVALTGIVVIAVGIIAGSMYLNARSETKAIAAFAQIGEGLENIPVIGESGLLAIADAQSSRAMAEELERLEKEEKQVDENTGKIEVMLNMTSIQKDLKIKFVNKTSGKLIPSIAFEAEVTPPDGKNYVLKDDDKDGIIYKKNIAPGKYKVAIIGPDGLSEYSFSREAVTITVRDTIEYKKVEVADEIKSESQVNAAVEDTAVNNTEVESTNTDTVEWVESTKTLIEGTEKSEDSYEKVSRSDITDPAAKTAAGFRLLSRKVEEESGGNNNSETTPEPVQTETPTPEPAVTATPTAEAIKSPETPTEAPTEKPRETKSPEATTTPTAVTPTTAPTATPSASASASASASVSPSPSVSPSATPTVTPSATPTPANSARTDTKTDLKNNSGDKLYVKDSNGNFREAKYADYYNNDIKEFYRKSSKTTGEYRYTGWQTIDGATYFFDKNGNKVTGRQVIQGAEYKFNDNGVLDTGSGHMGIDVSKWNGGIDWKAVKNSGVSYAIIRCGYRGSTTGALIEDPKFRSNIQGAQNAGLKVGVYFFTQAVNEVEAVEEASMVLSLIKGYNISYPVFLDVEASNGRGDAISADTRTAVCKAFCQTIQNSGYKAGIYANKTWFTSYMNTPSLTGYKIWLAQYAAAPSYTRTRYDLWQYSSKGKVSGISGNVDMNISYLGY